MFLSRSNMFLSSVFLVCSFAVLIAADPVCDPETQYLENGQCCLKCKPGTSMKSKDCSNPVCIECDEGEYMDKYNTEQRCERQPYCDLNLNFESQSSSKTKRVPCLCREGFHCYSQTCLICAPHTECEPGYGAKTTGGQTRDTQCEKCPNGTFSDEKSWNGMCKKMTECPSGYEPQGGSSESDNRCVLEHRGHIGVICAVIIIPILLGLAVFLYCKCKNKSGYEIAKMRVDNSEGVGKEEEDEREEEKPGIITSPTDDIGSLPVESEYLPSPTQVVTANGFILCQDNKEHTAPTPETQGMDYDSHVIVIPN